MCVCLPFVFFLRLMTCFQTPFIPGGSTARPRGPPQRSSVSQRLSVWLWWVSGVCGRSEGPEYVVLVEGDVCGFGVSVGASPETLRP